MNKKTHSKIAQPIEAIVFDMDGVLIDSREMIYQAMEHVLSEKQVLGITRADIAEVTGKPISEMYRLLVPQHNSTELETQHMNHHEDNIHLLQGFEDTHTALRQLRDAGYRLGVFTGFNELTYNRLDQFGLMEYFQAIVDATQYQKIKPDPEGLLMCIDRLSARPESVLYIGDSKSDMIAGKAAGVYKTVGITTGFSSAEILKDAGADYIVDSLTDFAVLIDTMRGDDES